MKFVKMHGLGNDFVVIDETEQRFSGSRTAFAKKYCDRNFGIGGDGVIFIQKSATADYKMQVINSDGSEAEMCGNGIRCVAKYLMDAGKAGSSVKIETAAGIMKIRRSGKNYAANTGKGKVMGKKSSNGKKIVAVSMGNPHAVIFVDNYNFNWRQLGKNIENDTAAFPQKTNVEFVKINSSSDIDVKVWERGAGPTLACGTGACASLVAAAAEGKTGRKAAVHLPGGTLQIEWQDNGDVIMTGPAETVFEGEI